MNGNGQIVYVKTVKGEELPEDIKAQLGGSEPVFAIHGINGERIALVKDRRHAFVLARRNNFSPVPVH